MGAAGGTLTVLYYTVLYCTVLYCTVLGVAGVVEVHEGGRGDTYCQQSWAGVNRGGVPGEGECLLELQTKVKRIYQITEKAPARALGAFNQENALVGAFFVIA